MIDITRVLREFAASTSRRGVLARIGAAVVGASLFGATQPTSVSANVRGCHDGCRVGTKGGFDSTCCPSCVSCGIWCSNTLQSSSCPADHPNPGWYWYCCQGTVWLCQDCCTTNNAGCCTLQFDTQVAC